MKRNWKIALVSVMCGSLILAVSAVAMPQAQAKQQPQPQASEQARLDYGYQSRLGGGLAKWLGLTPEQESQFDALRKAHRDQRQALHEEMGKLGDELRSMREDPKADPKKADALIDRLEQLRADQMKSGFRFGKDLEKILTPDQRKKLEQVRSRFDRGDEYGGYGMGPYMGWGYGGYWNPYFMGPYWGGFGLFGGFRGGFFGGFRGGFRGFRGGFGHRGFRGSWGHSGGMRSPGHGSRRF